MTLNRRGFTLSSLAALGAMSQAPLLGASGIKNQRIVLVSRPQGKPNPAHKNAGLHRQRLSPAYSRFCSQYDRLVGAGKDEVPRAYGRRT